MKKTRLLACMLLVVMLVSSIATTASAASIHLVEEDAKIYVDDKLVKNVDAYVDKDGNIRVYTVEELYKVLPELEEEVFVLPSREGYVVVDYLEFMEGYSFSLRENKLYIYTDEDVINISDIVEEKPCKVYVNGLYIATADVYISQSEGIYVVGFNDIYKMFPKETKNMYLPFTDETTYLKDWADRFGYKITNVREKVFLNNNGRTPVEVRMEGTRIDFPDQQPIIVPPGRTMIPVASVAKVTGCEVTWDGEHNRVIVTKDNNKLILWIGNESYWFNGHYYKMDVKPYILNGRTMVPIRFISEVFGYRISTSWENDVFIVNLSSGW